MSEANTPFNEQGLPESVDLTHSAWEDADGDNSEGGGRVDDGLELTIPSELQPLMSVDSATPDHANSLADMDNWQDWQTIDFPNAVSTDAIERQPLYPDESVSMQPDVADLVSLIQELNQCNNILLDRVSQLEDALERSQTALKAEVERSQSQPQSEVDSVQAVAVAHEQIVQLSNQLEFAQQNNQRQQIRIETLTAQLDSSQERVALLEREAALAQQRFDEQSHLLTQTETVCRDLQSRLQRQQRYTLQFKAALEKCLDVPPPSYESSAEPSAQAAQAGQSDLPAQLFLPKVQRIQPWSFQDSFLQGHAQSDSEATAQSERSSGFSNKLRSTLSTPLVVTVDGGAPTVSQDSDTFAPVQPISADRENAAADPMAAAAQPPVGYEPQPDAETTDTVQLRSNLSDSEFWAEAETDTVEPDASLDAADLQLMLNALATGKLSTSEIAAAEDALWQDLAKLIDASAEDIAKVSTSDNFAEFEAAVSDNAELDKTEPDASALNSSELNAVDNSADAVTPVSADVSSADDPSVDAPQPVAAKSPNVHLPKMLNSGSQESHRTAAQRSPLTQNGDPSSELPGVLTANSAWPSPVVYPLRPPKKRTSLAAVDLPTFPR